MDMLQIIEAKKRGSELGESEIEAWVRGVVDESIPLYQSASLLMAIRLNGMTFDETWLLTRAMANSGDRVHYKGFPVVVDKHSTGGVGDKVTLILAPLVAACGVPVAMLSGRSLGFTGGTIDKFESIAGVTCEFDDLTLQRMMQEIGWVNAQPSSRIAPADRALYALRDVTGTVDSIPLITASIMSKKMCGGGTHLCLDVKCGPGAFMQNFDDARKLASSLKQVGILGGLKMAGVISRMAEPLGQAVGNYVEMWEAVRYLTEWPKTPLAELVMALADHMLKMYMPDEEKRAAMLMSAIESGAAIEALRRYLDFCGGDVRAIDQLMSMELTQEGVAVTSTRDGFVNDIDGYGLALCARELGAGRITQNDRIDPMAGFILEKQLADEVKAGDVLLLVYGKKAKSWLSQNRERIPALFTIGNSAIDKASIILDEV